MAFESYENQRPKKGPLRPALGFILLLVVGALSWFVSPRVADWLTTTDCQIGSFQWQILPLEFPEAWPSIAVQGLVALFTFMITFITFMVVFVILLRPPRGRHDVSVSQARARQKEVIKKRRKS